MIDWKTDFNNVPFSNVLQKSISLTKHRDHLLVILQYKSQKGDYLEDLQILIL